MDGPDVSAENEKYIYRCVEGRSVIVGPSNRKYINQPLKEQDVRYRKAFQVPHKCTEHITPIKLYAIGSPVLYVLFYCLGLFRA